MNQFNERKARILEEVQREAGAAARRRRAMHAGAGACALALLAGGVWFMTPGPRPSTTLVATAPDPRAADPRIDLADYTISDEELVAALDEAGGAYTMVWVEGRPRLIDPPEPDAPAPI